MENIIIGIIGVVLSAASLIVMVFGIRLGKKAITKNLTLYGVKAKERLEFLEKNTLKDATPVSYIYGGGNLTTPKLQIEKMTYDKDTMPVEWKKCTKLFQYFDKSKENPKEIWVEEWRV